VRQGYVDRLSAEFASDCVVLRHGSSALVEMAEAKLRGGVVSVAAVAAELAGLTGQPGGMRMDRVVLACTHFPLLRAELAAAAMGLGLQGLGFDDGGPGIARRVKGLLAEDVQGPDSSGGGGLAVFTRGGPAVDALAPALQGFGLTEMETL
jgi:glutamate racemase